MKTPVLKTLFNKVASLQTFLKRGSNTAVFCGFCELFKNSFFKENPVAASDSPTAVH